MELSADLRKRLAALRGDLLLERRLQGTVPEAGWLACDLLEAGLDTPAVQALIEQTLSIGPMSEVETLVRQVLTDAGFPPIDVQRDPWAVARDVAQGIVEGSLPISQGTSFLIWESMSECGHPSEVTEFMILIEDWQARCRTEPPTDDELRGQAAKIVEAANRRLGMRADGRRSAVIRVGMKGSGSSLGPSGVPGPRIVERTSEAPGTTWADATKSIPRMSRERLHPPVCG
ncbi:hypothetical protein ACFFMN_25630 [Planobispora siamensis]|uniref:hypothetical protein n=1 Tax=Planobispora siamensis TaxID=936338 RepID=UPI00194DAFEF|nr:hypothetical protein [Planobispora siamensis]